MVLLGFVRMFTFLFSGSKNFGKQGYEQASKNFDQSILNRRLDGRSVMVTGANQGLGLKTCEELAKRGCTLYMVCRNAQRGEEAVQAVRAMSGNSDVHLKVCDHPASRCTCLSTTLVSWCTKGKSSPSKVVFISSGGMLTEKLDVVDLQNVGMGSRYDGTVAYARDKRRQVALVEHFATQFEGTGVAAYTMHPGWTTTEGVKDSIPGFYSFFKNKFRDLQQGADTIVWLALQSPDKLEPGAFYLDRAPQTKHLPLGGTQYSKEEVDTLVKTLEGMLHKAQQC
ncbi:MAG: hypothetical protein WDW36_006722 [Sanguina aurantia]